MSAVQALNKEKISKPTCNLVSIRPFNTHITLKIPLMILNRRSELFLFIFSDDIESYK